MAWQDISRANLRSMVEAAQSYAGPGKPVISSVERQGGWITMSPDVLNSLLKGVAFEGDTPDWLVRCKRVAWRIVARIQEQCPDLQPQRSETMDGDAHALFMAVAIRDGTHGVDTPTKACRWLGYLQRMCVESGLCTPDEMKTWNLESGAR